MKKLIVTLCLLVHIAFAQTAAVVYPTNWFIGMKNPDLHLLVHSPGIGEKAAVRVTYPGVRLLDWHRTENPNYLFLHLRLDAAVRPGDVAIDITPAGGSAVHIKYALLPRRKGNGTRFAKGVTSSDFIYFVMPDRFSNGDTANDRVAGMRDRSLGRGDSIAKRHGGDMQGLINHLDYLQSLGVTTLWMTPVLVNDMPHHTFHGYAFTDHYTIDARLGGAEAYSRLSDSLHARGMKLIQDAVYNHVGLYHLLVQDLPEKSWLHQWPSYTQTNYRGDPVVDPHASAIDRKLTSDGWFTREMPDLNQNNPDVANFLIQHAIWSVETFGVDGWRIDTYIYNDLDFMNRCNKALLDEYPHITMFGETWVNNVADQAYFTRNHYNLPYKSNLTGCTDFQCLFNGIAPALRDTTGGGLNQLYLTLSNDFLYQEPMNNVIFLDNHDMTRFLSQMGEDVAAQRMGLQWLLTERGIPQLYYGTEILMKGVSDPDGWVRMDFPGGWAGDRKNAFTGEGLSEPQRATQLLVRTLGRYRLHSSAIRTGKMMQYVPQGSLYVYFRYDDQQTVLCAMNTGNKPVSLDFNRFAQRTEGFSLGIDVLTGEKHPLGQPATLPARTMWVLELTK